MLDILVATCISIYFLPMVKTKYGRIFICFMSLQKSCQPFHHRDRYSSETRMHIMQQQHLFRTYVHTLNSMIKDFIKKLTGVTKKIYDIHILTLGIRISTFIDINMILMSCNHLSLSIRANANVQFICTKISTTHPDGPSYATI